MNKFLLFSLLNSFVWAQTIHFKEQKYLYALDNFVYKKGTITFEKNSIKLSYEKSTQLFVYENEKLFIQNKNHLKEIDLNKEVGKKVFFLLLKAIYEDDTTTLQNYFSILTNTTKTTLIPKEPLASFIEKIEYKKNKRLEFLTIYLLNLDRITVEETH
ncbi:MAG: hypothetical protein ACNI3C_02990 [Candidatus Marinarcus sp.]|uniref:hypothetical protein n=1 Tax=Candidatus Marinarcus sp. TaxID=3100987 RepID=UPI003B0048E6